MRHLKFIKRFIVCFVLCLTMLTPAHPLTVQAAPGMTNCDVTFYTKPATPYFASPDLYSGIIGYLDKNLPVHVTGFTDNNFFRIDLGTTVYIPVSYLMTTLNPKSEDTQEKEMIKDYADAYVMILEQQQGICEEFGLQDITGDDVPELILDNKQVYTYYMKRPMLIYYNMDDKCTLYYSKGDNLFSAKVKYNGDSHWELYTLNKAIVPYGNFQCTNTDISPYKNRIKEIKFPFDNDADDRGDVYDHLYHLLGQAKLCSTCKEYYG